MVSTPIVAWGHLKAIETAVKLGYITAKTMVKSFGEIDEALRQKLASFAAQFPLLRRDGRVGRIGQATRFLVAPLSPLTTH